SIPLPPLPPSPRPSSNNGRGGTAEGESGTGARVNPAEIAAAFHDLHRRRYGHADPGRAVEIVNLRYRLVVPGHEPQIEAPPKRARTVERARLVLTRQWHGRWIEAPVYDRTLLSPGDQFSGPAVVVQMDATTVLPPGWLARVDELGNLLLQGSSRASASG
ncbi:MAG: hypothetical protein ACR2PL_00735, partial [Dehalococcoidia bacterium]